MSGGWNAQRMLELGRRHAELEGRCDLDGTMATLIVEPVYEFFPVGLRMRGVTHVRRYYENLFGNFIGNTSHTLIAEWVSESSVAQEYEIVWDPKGKPEAHRVIGILFRAEGSELLGGERIYASERCARLMLGDALCDELEPIGR